jgi:hypothetical protein
VKFSKNGLSLGLIRFGTARLTSINRSPKCSTFSLVTNFLKCSSSKSKSGSKSTFYYDRWSFGQSVLVSGFHLGPVINFLFYRNYVSAFAGFILWGALSDERIHITDLLQSPAG